MAFVGPNTQFKITAAKFRRTLRALGFNYIQVYNRLLSFKLKQVVTNFTVTALSTATTAGSQYTSPNGQVCTVLDSAPVGTTAMRMSCAKSPDASGTLTLVASSSGTLGTAQSTIAYSAVTTTPGSLGPYQPRQ